MNRKQPSPAQRALTRLHLNDIHPYAGNPRGIIQVFVSTLTFLGITGTIAGLLIGLVITLFTGQDTFAFWASIGFGAGVSLSVILTGVTIHQALQHRHPQIKHIKDPVLAKAINTALVELPVGFKWTFEGDDKDGTLSIAPEDDTESLISTRIIDTDPDCIDSDQSFTEALECAAGMLHEFFLATKHLSKDPARVGPQGSHMLRIVRDTQKHPDRDIITGRLWLAEKPDDVRPTKPVTVMHEHSENLPVRLVTAVFPAWAQIHQELTQADTQKKLTREKTKTAAASQFLQQRALEEISRPATPTDDELFNEL